MTELAGKYAGMKVADARAAVIADLKKDGTLVEQKDNPSRYPYAGDARRPSNTFRFPSGFLRLSTSESRFSRERTK